VDSVRLVVPWDIIESDDLMDTDGDPEDIPNYKVMINNVMRKIKNVHINAATIENVHHTR
jgi:hypothetical protein